MYLFVLYEDFAPRASPIGRRFSMIYLDHAATTPIPKAVADAMYEELTEHFANPSSQYAMGREAKERVEKYRATIKVKLHPLERAVKSVLHRSDNKRHYTGIILCEMVLTYELTPLRRISAGAP